MTILVGGDRVLSVSAELAAAFAPGDRLFVVAKTGEVLHVPHAEKQIASDAVARTQRAFFSMGQVSDSQIVHFFRAFAKHLADDSIWAQIERVNQEDVTRAQARGRSTTRLVASEKMRADMIAGLEGWAQLDSMRNKVLESVDHGSWTAELVGAELGVVAFIFEGRPNVVADATGVLRGGNTVVFRIGSDALATARAIVDLATRPALQAAGLPLDAVTVVDSTSHAAGWALFSDARLALAVARGSGPAVDTLGSLAQSAGVPVSLHGTGGAWLMLTAHTDPGKVAATVADCLDRKVCNTLNTCCIEAAAADRLIPEFLNGLALAAQRRNTEFKLHVAEGSEHARLTPLFTKKVAIGRASGESWEPQAESLPGDRLGHEWEWEDSPEVTLKLVSSLDEAVTLFNAQSPQFVACLNSEQGEEHDRFWSTVNAPFVGDGFTRWVDGQFALGKPELGLSNWERGRLFGRGGVLSGDSVYTVRTRVRGTSSGRPAR